MHKFLFLFLLFPFFYIKAQPIKAMLSADSSHILIGNPLTLRLSIEADNHLQVQPPILKDSLGKWEILQISPLVKGNDKGKTLFSQNIVVTAWDSGRYEIPALPVFYINGQDSQQIATNPIAIQVLTVAVDTTQAIKPIKVPIETAYMWQEAIPYLAVLALLGLAGLGYFLNKKHKARKQKKAFPLAPRPKALQALDSLSNMNLTDAGQTLKYYTQISYFLRTYISETKGFSTYEKVSTEIISEISPKLGTPAVQSLESMLSRCDRVKFAKYTPEAHTAILQEAKDWVKGH